MFEGWEAYWRRKCEFAVEPSLHCLFIVRTNAGQLAWLQRVHVRIDNLLGKFNLIIVGVKYRAQPPSRECEKECGRRGQPMPKERLGLRSWGRDEAKIGANLFPKQGRRGVIELREPQSLAQQVQVHKLNGAKDALLEVVLEFRSISNTQLTVEIAMKEGIGKVTPHGQPPCEWSLPAPSIGGGYGEART
jgi:hypothetical protein